MHLSLPKWFPLCLFWLPLFSCFFMEMRQGHRGCHLFRLTCSVVLWGGRNTANITGVCGERSQCLGHTGFAPLTACVPSQSTLLRLQVARQGNYLKRVLGCMHFPGLRCSGSGSGGLPKGTDSAGPVFCALPRSEQLRQPGAWQAHCPSWVVRLTTSPVPSPRFPGCAGRAPSQAYHWGADL